MLAPILFIPASLATFVFGLLSAIEGDWDFGQAWIMIGLAGWLFSFLDRHRSTSSPRASGSWSSTSKATQGHGRSDEPLERA